MRVTGILVFLIVMPCIWAAMSNRLLRRDVAMFLLGLSFFAGSFLKLDIAFYSWPLWASPDRGYVIGIQDCIAIALIGTRKIKFNEIPFKFIFFAHALAITFSIAMSAVPVASSFTLWNFARAFLFYRAVLGEAHDGRMIDSLFKGLALGLMLEAGTVMYQKAHGAVQAPGTFSHQNLLAVVIELVLMPLIALFLERRNQWLFSLGVVAALIVLAGGGSRAGLTLAFFGIVLTLILSAAHSRNQRKMTFLFFTAVTVALAVPLALTTLSERFGSGSMVTTEDARDALEASARAMSADYPLGVGASMFVTTANRQGYATRAGVSWGGGTNAAPVHNAYLLELAELGWFGLITFCAFLVIPLLSAFRNAFRTPRTSSNGILVGSAAAFAVLLVHSFYEYAPVTYDCMSLIAMNIAIVGGYIRGRTMPTVRKKARPSNRHQAIQV